MSKKPRVDRRFPKDAADIVWIIIPGHIADGTLTEGTPEIIDVFDYEANDYHGVKDKYGQTKYWWDLKAAKQWAAKHPKRIK